MSEESEEPLSAEPFEDEDDDTDESFKVDVISENANEILVKSPMHTKFKKY